MCILFAKRAFSSALENFISKKLSGGKPKTPWSIYAKHDGCGTDFHRAEGASLQSSFPKVGGVSNQSVLYLYFYGVNTKVTK